MNTFGFLKSIYCDEYLFILDLSTGCRYSLVSATSSASLRWWHLARIHRCFGQLFAFVTGKYCFTIFCILDTSVTLATTTTYHCCYLIITHINTATTTTTTVDTSTSATPLPLIPLPPYYTEIYISWTKYLVLILPAHVTLVSSQRHDFIVGIFYLALHMRVCACEHINTHTHTVCAHSRVLSHLQRIHAEEIEAQCSSWASLALVQRISMKSLNPLNLAKMFNLHRT